MILPRISGCISGSSCTGFLKKSNWTFSTCWFWTFSWFWLPLLCREEVAFLLSRISAFLYFFTLTNPSRPRGLPGPGLVVGSCLCLMSYIEPSARSSPSAATPPTIAQVQIKKHSPAARPNYHVTLNKCIKKSFLTGKCSN